MVKRCYSCGESTRVIAGVLINAAEDADGGTSRKRRKTKVDQSAMFRFLPFQTVVGPLMGTLDAAWYQQHGVGPLAEREMDPEYRWNERHRRTLQRLCALRRHAAGRPDPGRLRGGGRRPS